MMTGLTIFLTLGFAYGCALVGYAYGHKDGIREGYTRGRDIARTVKW